MDVQLTWADCDEAGDYVVPNVLSPRDLVSRPDNIEETVLHTHVLPGQNPVMRPQLVKSWQFTDVCLDISHFPHFPRTPGTMEK